MRLHIRIKTPKGQAKGTESKLRIFLLGRSKVIKTWVNKNDDTFYWIVDAYHGDIARITKNVSSFGWFIHKVFSNKFVRMATNPQDREQLRDMLENNTTVEIVTPSQINEEMMLEAEAQNQPSSSV